MRPVGKGCSQHLMWHLPVLGREAASHFRMIIYNPSLEMQSDTFSWDLYIYLFTLFIAGLTNEKEMEDIQKSLDFYSAQTDCMSSNAS